MKPHTITNEALRGIAGQVALRLNKSESYIYSLGEDPEKDRYTRFVQFWLAIAGEDLDRAGLFVTDLASRYEALTRRAHARAGFPSRLLFDVAEVELNTAALERVPFARRESCILRLISELQSYLHGLRLDDVENSRDVDGSERAEQRDAGTPPSVHVAARRVS